MKNRIQLLPLLFLAGCGWGYSPVPAGPHKLETAPWQTPPAQVEDDPSAPFEIDPAVPFQIQFGHGSGWHGLNTVKISHDGGVVLHRQRTEERFDRYRSYWEKTTLALPATAMQQVVQAVKKHRVLHLEKAYHGNVADGTQWVLWIKQGEKEKSIYFNNHFPKEIVGFAKTLDCILAKNGLRTAAWQRTADGDNRKHAQELWKSLKR